MMHLTAPAESHINDGIDKDDFTFHYSTIDDVLRMVNKLGYGGAGGHTPFH